jgi:PAS domain S-box-containing protein
MSFEFWGINGTPFFGLPANFVGYGVIALYLLFLVLYAWRALPGLSKLRASQWAFFVALLAVSPILITALRIQLPGAAAQPDVPTEPVGPTLSLLGYVPILLAAGFLGDAPALLIALVAGVARAGWDTYRVTTILETAAAGALLAGLIRQDYRGPIARWLRQPLLAALLTALIVWATSYFSYFANSSALGLIGLDFVTAEWLASLWARLGEMVLAGLVASILQFSYSAAWAPTFGSRPPPYSTSLNRQLLFALAALGVGGFSLLIYFNLQIAQDVATTFVVEQMGRNAQTVANSVPYFAQTGQSVLNTLASDPGLRVRNSAALSAWLGDHMRGVAFFQSLAFFDQNNQLLGAYPVGEGLAAGLTAEEKAALDLGIPQTVTVDPMDPNLQGVAMSFVVPVADANGSQIGTLIGRTSIEENPILRPAIEQLHSLTSSNGSGFIVDDRGQIIYHTDRAQVGQSWAPAVKPAEALSSSIQAGRAYRDLNSSNTRVLVFYMPVSGYPWTVGIVMPNEVVLAQATQITAPMMVILVLIGLLGAGLLLVITNQITRRLEKLAKATTGIAQGEFDQPVSIAGEDEVGRLGLAFERMRERLRDRLGELNLLLRVSQGIAGSLSLDQSLPAVLDGALRATSGGGVRLVVLNGGSSPQVFFTGPLSDGMAPLDDDLLNIMRSEERLVLENLARTRTVLNVGKVAGQVQALIALPLKQESRYLGALWVGFAQPHPFTQTEVNFVSTLATQAALAVSNAHLYEASEGGRQQLQAILTSTPDAVIVTDSQHRIMLINPAAESTFDLAAHSVVGRPLAEVIHRPELVELMNATELATPREVPMPDGRTLFASASPINAADGGLLGRVAVLRDVTYFKQLDELKSEFVATVSHDLRVPLTYMRGYATMLPMVGQLNPKQAEFATKIVGGIEQMRELIEDLLDLNRIEAGVGLARETCRVEELINDAAANLRNSAANKNIVLTVELAAPSLPPITGDRTLLRQAISNLVDNAIKYTPNNGRIRVLGEVRDGHVVVAVQDNGIGIATTDLARLFEKFFRVRQRDNLGIKGSGLGLAIVKSIIDRHGGRIWVESRLGQGSTFFISLPA